MSVKQPDSGEPLISVVLVTANRAQWLEKPLECLYAQQEPSWELVAVDCASGDDTLERLQAHAQADERVRVFSVEETDRTVGRRHALEKVKGRYLAFLDANTLWSPEFLKSLVKSFSQVPENKGTVYALSHILDESGEAVRNLPEDLRNGAIVRELFEKPQFPLSALLVRRSVVKPLRKPGKGLWLGNDYALMLWLAYETPFEPGESRPMVRIRPIEGQLPGSLDAVSEARGEALTAALEGFASVVPARFARWCLADYHRGRSLSLAASGEMNTALGDALRALMYRPLWLGAWKQLLRIALGR